MSAATDIIYLNHEQDNMLLDLWQKSDPIFQESDIAMIPADLFIAKTLPLHDFDIILDERGQTDGGELFRVCFRVVDEKLDGIQTHRTSDGKVYEINHVMDIIMGATGMPAILMAKVGMTNGMNYMTIFDLTAINDSGVEALTREVITQYHIDWFFMNFLQTWYGAEVAMLHPTVCEVFSHPIIKKEKLSRQERKTDRQKIYRYVKHHYINTTELNDAIYGKNTHSINRKALIWYVSGHWREYKTGKKIFIKPYWKGALRKTKTAEPRNRELVINKEVNT